MNNISQLIFVIETQCVYCEIGTEFLMLYK